MLTGTIKADWTQLRLERYLAALPTLKQGVITGVFKIKGVSLGAEKLQLSVFLPTDCHWFFLLAAAWVDPGRNALQSAEQRC